MPDQINPEVFLNNMMGEVIDGIVNGKKTLPDDQQQQLAGKVPLQDANFFTWCTPGIPVSPDDFSFLKGLRKPLDYAQFKDLSDAEKAAKQGDEAYALTVAMDNFSVLVDTVPNKSGLINSLHVWEPQQRISSIYESVLQNCEVADTVPSPDADARIKKIREATVQTVEKTDTDTGEKFTEERPSVLVASYNKYEKEYVDAYVKYVTLMTAASTGDAADVQKASMLGPVYYKDVMTAWDAWESGGHRSEYEKMMADLQQLEGISMSLLLKEYREIFQRSRRTSLLDGNDYSVSRIVPATFYESSGWTQYSFSASKLKSTSNSKSQDYSAGGIWGLFGGAKGSYSKVNASGHVSMDNLEMDFELTQVPIVRSWFREDFLLSNKWRYKTQGGAGTDNILSNGKADDPKGLLFAYPTVAIFARNIKITKTVYDQISSEVNKNGGGSGGFSLGPFSIGGSASYNRKDKNLEISQEGDKIVVPGMQIIGFRNHILPQSPNPDTAIDKWI